MAFPQVAAETSSQQTTNSTTPAVSLPAGISAGDLLLVIIGVSAVSAGLTITPPAGWTQEFYQQNGNNEGAFGAYSKVADGTEGATVTFTLNQSRQSSHYSARITGHNSGAVEASVNAANGDDVDPPNLSPSWGAKDTLWFALMQQNGWVSTVTYPTNYTNGFDIGPNSGSNRVTLALARRQLNAASENPGSFGVSEAWSSMAATLAIEPTAGGGTVFQQNVGGTISVSGNLTENIKLPLTSTIDIAAGLAFASFLGIAVGSTIGISGALVNITKFSLTSILSISGNLVNKAKLVLSSSLSITGILTAGTKFLQAIIGTLTSSGNVSTIYDEEGGVPSSGKRGHSIFGAISKRIRKGRRRRRR